METSSFEKEVLPAHLWILRLVAICDDFDSVASLAKTTQAFQNDPDLVFGRKVPTHRA